MHVSSTANHWQAPTTSVSFSSLDFLMQSVMPYLYWLDDVCTKHRTYSDYFLLTSFVYFYRVLNCVFVTNLLVKEY